MRFFVKNPAETGVAPLMGGHRNPGGAQFEQLLHPPAVGIRLRQSDPVDREGAEQVRTGSDRRGADRRGADRRGADRRGAGYRLGRRGAGRGCNTPSLLAGRRPSTSGRQYPVSLSRAAAGCRTSEEGRRCDRMPASSEGGKCGGPGRKIFLAAPHSSTVVCIRRSKTLPASARCSGGYLCSMELPASGAPSGIHTHRP